MGVYLFLEKLIEWACILHRSGQFVPIPSPALRSVFRQLWWITYRHEQFHFHVELFATQLESALRRPVYRPYVECVRIPWLRGPAPCLPLPFPTPDTGVAQGGALRARWSVTCDSTTARSMRKPSDLGSVGIRDTARTFPVAACRRRLRLRQWH